MIKFELIKLYGRIVVILELIMHSIRTKTTLLNVIAIVIAMLVATIISAFTIANLGHQDSEKALNLLCETGKNNLNYYFKSVSQSIDTVSSIIEDDLRKTDDADFGDHIRRSLSWFSETAKHTNGALTYYYRIDPNISNNYPTDPDAVGFYWVKQNENDTEYTDFGVTPITTDEDGSCKWFWDLAPAKNPDRKAVWLNPYNTDRFEKYVISYNTPIYKNDQFYGVAGIEISYMTLGNQIGEVTISKNGYAYVMIGEGEERGKLVFHPNTSIDLNSPNPDEWPNFPAGVKNALDKYDALEEKAKEDPFHFEYKYHGVTKHASLLKLSNGMVIVVCVPLSEVNGPWVKLIIEIVIAALIILLAFILVTVLYTRHLTKPLKELTVAAEEIDRGNYKVKIEYKGNDEIGTLASTVNRLIEHLDGYIADLNTLAYADALTDVRSKSAYDIFAREMQARMDDPNDNPEFAIAFFDCDDLKEINDRYGHDKGDVYLKNSCHLICRIFQKSPIFRIGGDEFVVVLMGEDYQRREALRRHFIEKSSEISAFAKEPWENICVAIGVAVYNASIDQSVEDVLVRADHLMYENKRDRKNNK